MREAMDEAVSCDVMRSLEGQCRKRISARRRGRVKAKVGYVWGKCLRWLGFRTGEASGIQDIARFASQIESNCFILYTLTSCSLSSSHIMEQTPVPGSAGAKLKELRLRLHLTLRDVEARSRKLAAEKQSPDYFISRGWLNNVENNSFTPSIYKIYALETSITTAWTNIVSFFGLHVSDIGRDQAMFGLPKTQLLPQASGDDGETIVVPLRSRPDLRLDKTNLLSRLVEIWGEIPFRLIQHFDPRKGVYGVIGMTDYTMWPFMRPGSIVQIDGSQRKIFPSNGRTNMTRPIYFVELRDEYICSWCEIREGHLLAVPHPNSRCEIRRFPYPREADIVGRVTGVNVAMRATGSHDCSVTNLALVVGKRTRMSSPRGELSWPNARSQTTKRIAAANIITGS